MIFPVYSTINDNFYNLPPSNLALFQIRRGAVPPTYIMRRPPSLMSLRAFHVLLLSFACTGKSSVLIIKMARFCKYISCINQVMVFIIIETWSIVMKSSSKSSVRMRRNKLCFISTYNVNANSSGTKYSGICFKFVSFQNQQ